MSASQGQFLGIRFFPNVRRINTAANGDQNQSASWLLSPVNQSGPGADVLPPSIASQTFVQSPVTKFYQYLLTPTQYQGTSPFGDIVRAQFNLTRVATAFSSAPLSQIAGRTIIYSGFSNQIYVFAPKAVSFGTFTSLPAPFFSESLIEQFTMYSTANSPIEVYIEQDVSNGAAVAPSTQMTISLFNFEYPTQGRLL